MKYLRYRGRLAPEELRALIEQKRKLKAAWKAAEQYDRDDRGDIMNETQTKSPLKSKFNWLGLLVFLTALSDWLSQGNLTELIGDEGVRWTLMALGVIIVVLRTFFTNQGVELKK